MPFIFASASVTVDVEQSVINVIESQELAEVCLVKSGPSSHSITAVLGTEEIMDSDLAGSGSSAEVLGAESEFLCAIMFLCVHVLSLYPLLPFI